MIAVRSFAHQDIGVFGLARSGLASVHAPRDAIDEALRLRWEEAKHPPAGGPESGEETERNQDAIPVDGEIAELKGNFVHAAGKLGSAL